MKEELINIGRTIPEVLALIERNTEILESSNIIIREYKTDICLNPLVDEISGGLRENGFLYLNTKCMNAVSYPLGTWKKYFASFYPKSLYGQIDFLGNLEIRATEIGYSFFPAKRPKGFKCVNITSGAVKFEVESLTNQSNRNQYTTKLVGDPFSKNEARRKEFMSNKRKLESYL